MDFVERAGGGREDVGAGEALHSRYGGDVGAEVVEGGLAIDVGLVVRKGAHTDALVVGIAQAAS